MLTACASVGGGSHDQAPEEPSALFVENRSWSPVTVYLSASGQAMRVGSVDSFSHQSFSLEKYPTALNGGDLFLVARPLAGRPFRSESFVYSPGRTTVWTIENQSSLSQLVVR
jgi:hypothetical protein